MAEQRPGLTSFGKEVKKRLIDKNMTQVELAAELGCTKQYLYKILCGERSGKKYRERILQILGIGEAA